jgi:hypothetical protein
MSIAHLSKQISGLIFEPNLRNVKYTYAKLPDPLPKAELHRLISGEIEARMC